jgi:hypothetical protein
MIRPATAFWIALAGCVGFGLYHLKHEVQALEDDLFRVNRQILSEQEAIHVLHAEWNYMNQPARLQALASRHLDLQPMKTSQIGTLADLPRRPGETAPAAPPAPAVPAVPMAAAPRIGTSLASVSAHAEIN